MFKTDVLWIAKERHIYLSYNYIVRYSICEDGFSHDPMNVAWNQRDLLNTLYDSAQFLWPFEYNYVF